MNLKYIRNVSVNNVLSMARKKGHLSSSITLGDCTRCSHHTFGFWSWCVHAHAHVHHIVTLSWDWNFWNFPWGVGGFLFGFALLLSKLFLALEGVGIGSGNADEIGVKEGDAGGNEQTPNDECLLGLLVVSLVWGSGEHIWVFVAPENVANVPNGEKCGGDNDKLASDKESAS